jgi:carbon monoxide dehydrogenase subunit G
MSAISVPPERRTCWPGSAGLIAPLWRYAPSMADTTTSSITIAVPRASVMAVIADFAAYPEWATGVRAAEIIEQRDDGRASRVRFTLDAGPIKDKFVLRYQWEGDAQVRWDFDPAEPGTMISELAGGYLLTDRGSGTDVTYDLTIGVRIPMIGILKRKAEKTVIDTALKGLKKRAENGGGATT